MTYLLVQYGVPPDAAAFDRYYRETHIPLAKTLPGLRELTISDGPVSALAGTAPHLVALLSFDSARRCRRRSRLQRVRRRQRDLVNFATGGVTMVAYQGRMA